MWHCNNTIKYYRNQYQNEYIKKHDEGEGFNVFSCVYGGIKEGELDKYSEKFVTFICLRLTWEP